MPLVDRGTHRIWYDTRGKDGNPPLLLIMGMGFSSRAWGDLPERLSGDFRVVVFDNRGSGRSTAPLRPYRVKDMAADAVSVLEAACAPKAFVFGIIIALVGCWRGYRTHGGAEGVGNAPTSSVVTSSLWILIADFFITKLLLV